MPVRYVHVILIAIGHQVPAHALTLLHRKQRHCAFGVAVDGVILKRLREVWIGDGSCRILLRAPYVFRKQTAVALLKDGHGNYELAVDPLREMMMGPSRPVFMSLDSLKWE